MQDDPGRTFTVFDGHRAIARGSLAEAALAQARAVEAGGTGPVLIFDDQDGRQTDADPRWAPMSGGAGDAAAEPALVRRGPGRPKLGVVAREVTLLPRHWDWLSTQPGGASTTLRKLVETARRDGAGEQQARARRDAAYAFISAIGGDLPDFDEAARALFAGDAAGFAARTAAWPQDVRGFALDLWKPQAETAAPTPAVAQAYLQPSQDAGRDFILRDMAGPLVMLNLVRFRAMADYAASPAQAPTRPITGAEAFRLYVDQTLPLLRRTGGDLLFLGDNGRWLIGPPGERWDAVMLVRQSSAQAFLAFASDPAYLPILAHRTAALEDSRLLPLAEIDDR